MTNSLAVQYGKHNSYWLHTYNVMAYQAVIANVSAMLK